MTPDVESLIESWDGAGVLVRFDRPTGTWMFLCLHDGTLGPYMGGTRIRTYPSLAEAVRDGMRLAQGMTSKWAAIGFEAGGGKAVLAVPRPLAGEERRGLLERYGKLVESLNGAFQTGEDLGTSSEDMAYLSRFTRYVHGFDPDSGAKLDPAPYTGRGVFAGLSAAVRHVYGTSDLKDRTVLIQGVGHVGWELGRLLADAGASLLVADVEAARIERTVAELGAEAIPVDDVYTTPCDIYAPCALGGTVNAETVPSLRCRIVAGAANNQLGERQDADRLHERGILYVPDFVGNSGGAMAFSLISRGSRPGKRLFATVAELEATVGEILTEAAAADESPLAAAERRVAKVLAAAARTSE